MQCCQIFEKFRELAGSRPQMVVIPTASSRKVNQVAIRKVWKERGFENVEVLHAADRDEALKPNFIQPLKHATAVWFGGGSQQRIADAYRNTPVEKELHKLLARGGVIGGTSAGAAIQSRVMIAGGKTEPKLSTGFDLLPESIVDQHFLKRNRIPRLVAAVRNHPRLIGLGIDEGTALILENGKATVLGKSYVLRIESVAGKIQVSSFSNGDSIVLPPKK